ncbi:unnamed protein product [Peronospora belbahrii]|uniref:FYVE-type domain-containing protein n=1 Tax=Peronospora belbahrii TaxID=622444 RepID=A0AAU9L757_9STRA|nr:unnamed protein product [Peronospora belbahrii]CAH0514615.1 unnamed protein product [Peronospora belbahrii]
MSTKRFTVNPFDDLTLTDEDRMKLVQVVDKLALAKFAEYEEHLNNNKKVDRSRWKKVSTSGTTAAYMERKKSNPNSPLAEMLFVGPLPGTLDENMFGFINPTLDSMRINASYLNNFSAAAVLATIVEPTVDDPFRAVVVKWMEVDIPGASFGIVWNRDYVFVEGSGILYLKNGERVGYHVYHSVNFRETHELPNRVRGDMSLSAIFRQEGGRTDCRGTGILALGGEIVSKMAVMKMAQSVMSGMKYSYCGQMKKLAWLLEQNYTELGNQSASIVEHHCVTCSKSVKGSLFGKSNTTCRLCFGALCGSCKVSKKLSFISPDLELSQRKVSFCVKCLVEASRVDTLEVARRQLIYKLSVQPDAYSASLAITYTNSCSDESS